MARLRASQSQEQSEAARETARLAMRNRRANNRDQQVDNFRRTRRDLSSADLNRAAFRYDRRQVFQTITAEINGGDRHWQRWLSTVSPSITR